MLYWSLVFFVIALISGLLGFGTVASTASAIAQVFFVVFAIVFLFALVAGLRGRSRNRPSF